MQSSAELKREGQTPRTLGCFLRLLYTVHQVAAVLDEVEPLVLEGSGPPGRASRGSRTNRLVKECRRLTVRYRNSLARAVAGFCKKRAEKEEPGSSRRTIWKRQSEFFEAEVADDT
jgi:hypothetical protein